MTLLDTIPGVARQSAQLLLAEVGTDMQRFPTAAHLCKWAGVCLGNHESAGKQYSGKTPPSNRWLRGMLVQMANAAVRCKTSYFACVYRRLAARRGHKRAIIAVAHRLLIAVYHMLRQHQPYFACVYRRLAARRGHKRAIIAVAHRLLIAVYHMLRQHQPYRDYRATVPRQHTEQLLVKKLQQRVERLGDQVQLIPITTTPPPS